VRHVTAWYMTRRSPVRVRLAPSKKSLQIGTSARRRRSAHRARSTYGLLNSRKTSSGDVERGRPPACKAARAAERDGARRYVVDRDRSSDAGSRSYDVRTCLRFAELGFDRSGRVVVSAFALQATVAAGRRYDHDPEGVPFSRLCFVTNFTGIRPTPPKLGEAETSGLRSAA